MLFAPLNKGLQHPLAKPLVWLLALLPLLALVYGAVTDSLGANPAEALIRSTGDWALRGLCVALAVTPLRQISGWNALARFRRLLGLFAFFYVLVHAMSYAWLDMGWLLSALWEDVVQRPFILVGALAAFILFLLALTSPKRVVRAMGARNWLRLHRCVHLAAWLALLHFFWMRAAKNNLQEVWVYVAIVVMLQAWRVWHGLRRSQLGRA